MLPARNNKLTDLLQNKLNLKRPSARSYASLIRRLFNMLKKTGPLKLGFLDTDAAVRASRSIVNVGRRKNVAAAALAGTRAADINQKRQNEYRKIMLSADMDYKKWASSGKRPKGFTGDAEKLWADIRNMHKKVGRVITAKNIFKRSSHNYTELTVLQQYVFAKLLSHFEPRRLEVSRLRFITPDQLRLFSPSDIKKMNYILMAPKHWQLVYNYYKTSRSYGAQSYKIPPGLKTTLKKVYAIFSKTVPEGWVFFTRNNRPMSHSSFSKFVKDFFKTYFGRSWTQNTVRSIRVSALFKNAPSTQTLLDTQSGMGSNLSTLALNYRVPQ